MIFSTDTHGLVYHLTGQKKKLGRRARVIFERTERRQDAVLIPFTALEEIMLLSEAGKIRIRIPFRDLLLPLMQADNFSLGENDADLLLEASALIGIRDPFDRMIVAQARLSGATLITADEKIQESALVKTVWD